MNAPRPQYWTGADALARQIIEKSSGRIVLAVPLGLGKPVQLVNALYRRAQADQSLSLTIYTALSLEKPSPKNEFERRFLGPIMDRLYANYVDLDYVKALRGNGLPKNIEVFEFFLTAGQWLRVDTVQQSYVSADYTHVWRYVLDAGVNVVAQLVAQPPGSSDLERPATYSLSCNPDLTLDLLEARRRGEASFLFVGQVNDELPFMGRDAEIDAGELDHLLSGDSRKLTLFSTPKGPVTSANYAAAFHAARLIPDGGALQIGIGSLGDAIAHALITRHQKNDAYRRVVDELAKDAPPRSCHDKPFDEGLYGVSEMLVDAFLDLIDAGVVKREVDGCLVHAAFFLGPQSFYKRLRELPADRRNKLGMTSVLFVNDAHRDFEKKRRDRKNARFINNAMKASLLGSVVSDGLESGQVVSGVGGQFDFIRQAFALDGARSIIMLNATRDGEKGPESNIVWSYGHATIPRHYRDIIVTEYGVADIRGKSDAAVIEAMLSVADARFQDELIRKAVDAGKLPKNFSPPDHWRKNTPKHVERALRKARDEGLALDFPFGTDFTEPEKDLLPALKKLKKANRSKLALARLLLKGGAKGAAGGHEVQALRRMDLEEPKGMKERFYRLLLRGALDPP